MTYGLYFFSRYWRAKSSKVKECCLFILSPLQVRRWSRRTLTSASSACGRPASTPSSLTTMTFCDASGFSSVAERAFIDKAALSGVFFFLSRALLVAVVTFPTMARAGKESLTEPAWSSLLQLPSCPLCSKEDKTEEEKETGEGEMEGWLKEGLLIGAAPPPLLNPFLLSQLAAYKVAGWDRERELGSLQRKIELEGVTIQIFMSS